MSVLPIRIAVVGIGKIARDQHLPAIRANPAFRLAATVDPGGDGVDGVPHYRSLADLFERGEAVDALGLCTPPQLRFALAEMGIAQDLHVLLEKPPGVMPAEVAALAQRSREAGTTLFAAWHSRFAAGVEPARAWLAGRAIRNVRIVWREDVRVWHPAKPGSGSRAGSACSIRVSMHCRS